MLAAKFFNSSNNEDQEAPWLQNLWHKDAIKYVITTVDFGVWYSKDTNDFLVGYSDSDWAGNADDKKSTSEGCFYMGNNLIS